MERDAILVVGSANMDLVVTTPAFPAPGETVFGGGFGMYPGGKGANQAVCAAKLGGKTWVGPVRWARPAWKALMDSTVRCPRPLKSSLKQSMAPS